MKRLIYFIAGLVILSLLLAPLTDLHPVLATEFLIRESRIHGVSQNALDTQCGPLCLCKKVGICKEDKE